MGCAEGEGDGKRSRCGREGKVEWDDDDGVAPTRASGPWAEQRRAPKLLVDNYPPCLSTRRRKRYDRTFKSHIFPPLTLNVLLAQRIALHHSGLHRRRRGDRHHIPGRMYTSESRTPAVDVPS